MDEPGGAADDKSEPARAEVDNDTLKYQLLGPSLTKAGQDAVDQQKVCSASESWITGKLLNCRGSLIGF